MVPRVKNIKNANGNHLYLITFARKSENNANT